MFDLISEKSLVRDVKAMATVSKCIACACADNGCDRDMRLIAIGSSLAYCNVATWITKRKNYDIDPESSALFAFVEAINMAEGGCDEDLEDQLIRVMAVMTLDREPEKAEG